MKINKYKTAWLELKTKIYCAYFSAETFDSPNLKTLGRMISLIETLEARHEIDE